MSNKHEKGREKRFIDKWQGKFFKTQTLCSKLLKFIAKIFKFIPNGNNPRNKRAHNKKMSRVVLQHLPVTQTYRLIISRVFYSLK